MKPGVVLLSGGLDSATVLAVANSKGFACHALTVAYGQRHHIELEASRRVAKSLGAVSHRIFSLPLDMFGGSALTANIDVPKDSLSDGIPTTYVPARNTIFLALALGFAETLSASDIFCGVNSVDYSGYPDCRPEFIASFQKTARLATKMGVEGSPITIHAPLIDLTKPDIIRLGLSRGVDYSLTHSCYDPIGTTPCRHCDSCLIRIKAFADLGMEDPALA